MSNPNISNKNEKELEMFIHYLRLNKLQRSIGMHWKADIHSFPTHPI